MTFDDQKFRTGMCIGTGNNNGNGDDQIVPCMSLGTTPDAQLDLGFLMCFKIVPWPKKTVIIIYFASFNFLIYMVA